MAKILNIKKCWFHNSKYPHYDIPIRRIKEIEQKTIKISSKKLILIIKNSLT